MREYVYEANLLHFEGRGRRQKITSVSRVDSPELLAMLAANRPDELDLSPIDYYGGPDEPYDGLLSRAPKDTKFTVEGDEVDFGAAAPKNYLEVSMLAEFGPPKKHWRVRLEWSEGAQAWKVVA